MSAFIDLPLDKIVNRYRDGHSLKEIGDFYGVADTTVLNRLRSLGVNTRPRHCRIRRATRHASYTLDWVATMVDPDFDPDEREVVRDFIATHAGMF